MTVAGSDLYMARLEAESVMLSTVRISRRVGETRDPATGSITAELETVYEGPAKLRFSQSLPHSVDVVGQRLEEQRPTVSLPISGRNVTEGASADVRVDDEGEVITNDTDPALEGVTFRVAGMHAQTVAASRRLSVEVHSHA